MARPEDFLFNTDYEMDKIILFKQGEFTTTTEIDHGLNFAPLVFGIWSIDKDFKSVNTLGWADSSPQIGYTPLLSVECYATSSKIKLTSAGNSNNTKIYYRVYGFEPSGVHENSPKTSKHANQFVLNTDYNYLKLYKTGVFTTANEQIAHNFGYIPIVMAWVEMTLGGVTRIQPLETASEYTDFALVVTDSVLKSKSIIFPGVVDKIHWRIYYDKS